MDQLDKKVKIGMRGNPQIMGDREKQDSYAFYDPFIGIFHTN